MCDDGNIQNQDFQVPPQHGQLLLHPAADQLGALIQDNIVARESWHGVTVSGRGWLELIEEARQELESWSREGLHTVQAGSWMLVLLGELAHTAFVVQQPTFAEELEAKLEPFGALHRQLSGVHIYLGPVATCRAELARALGRRTTAVGHYEQAIEAAHAMGAPPHEAWAKAGLAQVLSDGGSDSERRQALGLANTALESGQQLGMLALVDEMEALGRSLR